jgi:hypothetical protein
MTEAARNAQGVLLVAALRSKGFTVRLGADDTLRVGPEKKLTLSIQEWIRKAQLLLIEELQDEPLESVAEVVELVRYKLNPTGIEYDPHPVPPAPPGRDPMVHKEGDKVGWDKVAFYYHPLECKCPDCIFPEPKYARPWKPSGNDGAA